MLLKSKAQATIAHPNGTRPGGEPESVREPADEHDRPDPLDRTANPLSIGGLVSLAADVLRDATDLPRPGYVTVHEETQQVSMLIEADASAFGTLGLWAAFFGATIQITPVCTAEIGAEHAHCHVDFDYYGVHVDVFALIPTALVGTR